MIDSGVGSARTWMDPEVTGWGRLAMRTPHVPCPDATIARATTPARTVGHEREQSPWVRSLDGTWRFRLYDRPEDVPAGVSAADFDDSETAGWRDIVVPGNWTMQDTGDRPHYTNIAMPFAGIPPEVPERNPTGVYRTRFRVPASWRGRRVVLHVGGAESVLHVHLNGRWLAVGKDSRLPTEVDLTDHLVAGDNTLACVVVRWCDASYLEDQDHWWMAGLHRRVFLYCTGEVWLDHLELMPGCDPDEDGDGSERWHLSARVRIGYVGGDRVEAGWKVRVRLERMNGRAIGRARTAEVPSDLRPYCYPGPVVALRLDAPGVDPWSAEAPALYRVVVWLIDPDGQATEVTALRVGFRRVAVADRELRINGAPVLIHGVNRHDHDPDAGKALSVSAMRRDLVTMKRHNLNALRCSHYPNDSQLYDLCDELGLYVIDEANLEAHAFIFSLVHDPAYRSAFLDRFTRMVERDLNHPSIIAWSLGNESGYGAVHDAMAAWARRRDPSRPLHYEGALMFDLYADAPCTDIVCPMYPEIDAIVAWAEAKVGSRPLIMCEYSHAMGNSNGSLVDYWEAIEAHHGLQGGFIWEWKDHGLTHRTAGGIEFFAYGGQFGDEPHDANFVADGLVAPDGHPHPAMREVAWVGRPVRVTATAADVRAGRVRVHNRQWFTDLSGLKGRWELTVDGTVVADGALVVPDTAPRTSTVVDLGYERPALQPGQEAFLTVRFFTRRATQWADRGHEVAWDQIPVRHRAPAKVRPSGRAGGSARSPHRVDLERDRAAGTALVAAGALTMRADEATGTVSNLTWHGQRLVDGPARLELWRAPTDNDGLKLLIEDPDPERARGARARALGRWLEWGLDRLHRSPVGGHLDRDAQGRVVIEARHKLWGTDPAQLVTHHQRVTVHPSGDLLFEEDVEIPAGWDDLPRLGVSVGLAPGFEAVEWFGLGPHETYPDRAGAATVGRWRCAIADHDPGYLVPQEHGAHLDTRWLVVTPDPSRSHPGAAVLVGQAGSGRLSVSALHHTTGDLYRAADLTELVPRPETYLFVDRAQRGLGTGSCGPDTLDRYRIGGGRHRWCWRLRPFALGTLDPAELGRRLPA